MSRFLHQMKNSFKDRLQDSALVDPYYLKNGSGGATTLLYHYSEIPHYLQGNPFIQRGYLSKLSYRKCFKSTFLCSNETVNVWSHLIGFLIFLALLIYDNLVTIPNFNGTISDHLIYTVYLTCFQVCMLCSVGFHLFRVHSEEVSKRWLSLDLAGVSIGMLGCYFPSAYYGFSCFPNWKNVHMAIVCLLLTMTLIVQLHRRFLTSAWANKRLLLFCLSVGYGIGPSIHWIYLHGGFQEEIVQIFVPKLVLMYTLAILALIFYATKCPERCFPGKVDYIGSSHQWWHVIIVIVFLWWHHVGIELVKYWIEHPCFSENKRLLSL